MISTSLEAWEDIKSSGALTGMRLIALHGVYLLEECTGAELNRWGRSNKGDHLHKRLSELERLKVISRSGSRKCLVTGHRAVTYVPTGSGPIGKLTAAVPRVELEAENKVLRRRVIELEDEVSRLRNIPRGQQTLFGISR